MATLFELLQGSYAYLLITQIVIVTGLFLGLLWLVVQRARRGSMPLPDGTLAPSAGSPVDLTELLQLREKLAQLEADNNKNRVLADENKTLREKVRYLESKLLEYEILQEEIGTLSALKLENEKLKEEIVTLRKRQRQRRFTTKILGRRPRRPSRRPRERLLPLRHRSPAPRRSWWKCRSPGPRLPKLRPKPRQGKPPTRGSPASLPR